ncbi:outer membrane protein [Candidatus Thermokryptus mobilis]|uniref:Outer membrane protein n=1 Tax=Candidatus Thermokryptus mobilis TaxID=1643428 RepID=A0A0S4MNQ6_9BACT|nr:TolC family protein [Candidatus Thermokryptus mobilis]CUU00738.1 outer membrane protein [Candidatus Thermokryptus mobilis]
MRRLFFFLILFFGISFSQGKKVLTLNDCVKIALENNTEIKRAEYSVQSQSASVLQAYGVFLPNLNLSGNWNRTRRESDLTFIPGLGTVPFRTSQTLNSFSTSVSTSILLFNGFANFASLSRARSSYLSADYNLRRTMQTVVFQTQQLYLNVLRNKQLLKVAQDNLKRSQRQLERILEANRVGSVSLADVYKQEVQVGNDELQLIRTQANYDKAKADLLVYLGLIPTDEYEFEDPSIQLEIDTTEFSALRERIKNLDELIAVALDRRPDYRGSISNLNSARSGVTVAMSGYMPTVSASAVFNLNSNEFKTLPNNRSIGWGINISFPIFDRFQLQTQVQQAKINVKNAEVQLEQVKRQITADVKKAILDIESAMKQLEVAQRQVKSAELDLKTAEEKYNIGAGTLLDLLIATANYTSAISAQVNAVYDYIIAKAQLQYALGEFDF